MIRQSPTRYFQNSPSFEPRNASPMLRGSTSAATRSYKNRSMRRVTWGSSLSRSRLASLSNSTFQVAMLFHHFLKRHGVAAASAQILQPLFGDVDVFEIVEVIHQGLADVVAFGSPSVLCQLVKPLFDGCRKSDGNHILSPHDIQV